MCQILRQNSLYQIHQTCHSFPHKGLHLSVGLRMPQAFLKIDISLKKELKNNSSESLPFLLIQLTDHHPWMNKEIRVEKRSEIFLQGNLQMHQQPNQYENRH